MDKEKDKIIDYILNNLMDVVVSLSLEPKVAVRYTISACIRFATRAANRLHIPPEDLLKEFQEEWMWNEADIRKEDAKRDGSDGSNNSGVLN